MTMGCCKPLTPEQILVLQGRLEAAEQAYHTLMIGGAVSVFVDQNSERIEYRASNRASLIGYINLLRDQLGLGPMCGVVAQPAGAWL